MSVVTSFVVTWFMRASLFGPVIVARPMCVMSNMPTLFLTARCSGMIPLYHSGIWKPANSVSLACCLWYG